MILGVWRCANRTALPGLELGVRVRQTKSELDRARGDLVRQESLRTVVLAKNLAYRVAKSLAPERTGRNLVKGEVLCGGV